MIPGLAAAGANIISGTINNLFQSGVRNAQIGVLDAQKAQIEAQTKINLLSNQQKYDLSLKLQNAKTETDRLKIMSDQLSALGIAQVQIIASGITDIQVQKIKSASAQNITLAIVVLAGSAIFLGAIFYIKKNS